MEPADDEADKGVSPEYHDGEKVQMACDGVAGIRFRIAAVCSSEGLGVSV